VGGAVSDEVGASTTTGETAASGNGLSVASVTATGAAGTGPAETGAGTASAGAAGAVAGAAAAVVAAADDPEGGGVTTLRGRTTGRAGRAPGWLGVTGAAGVSS
jgi:hypothetical protein